MSAVTLDIHSANAAHLHAEEEKIAKDKIFGFWIYLMTDCLMFSAAFACYIVLFSDMGMENNKAKEIFNLPYVFVESLLLLSSSLTFSFASIAVKTQQKNKVTQWLMITFIFGAGFILMELYEFSHLIATGNGPTQSGFLSGYFGLVGLHGVHVSIGLFWMLVMLIQVNKKGLNLPVRTRLSCLSLFWHFLDLVWICVFSVVYLAGVA